MRRKIKPIPEKRVRVGLYKCGPCAKQFTVKVGTVFEHARVPLHKMLQAVHLMCSSKKGISAHQMHRILEVQYNTAWFIEHRIREAMREGELAPMGGGGETVEADETYIGKKPGRRTNKRGPAHKLAVLSLVQRGGKVRSMHVDDLTTKRVASIVTENVSREAHLRTDAAKHYTKVGREFASHETVEHGEYEYVRYQADGVVHTNTIEGYFSIFKRGMKGVYQHCGEKHLHRYLAEFDFRYNSRSALGVEDQERANRALSGIKGKRLTYRGTDLRVP